VSEYVCVYGCVFTLCRCFQRTHDVDSCTSILMTSTQILASPLQFCMRFGHSRLFVASFSNVTRVLLTFEFVYMCARVPILQIFPRVSSSDSNTNTGSLLRFFPRFGHSSLFVASFANTVSPGLVCVCVCVCVCVSVCVCTRARALFVDVSTKSFFRLEY